jgi:hypothetical protein
MAIETASEINDEVLTIVDNAFFSINDTISYINKALKEIAGLVLLPKLLETETTIDTVVLTAYASLPANFMRNLHFCYSDTNNIKIKIYGDIRLLYREFSRLDLAGRVMGVAKQGDKLYYQRIPSSAETLRVHYYKYPTVLTASSNSPDCLPEFIVMPLLVNYIAKEMLRVVDRKETADKLVLCKNRYNEAMVELIRYVGPEARERQPIADELNLESYL